MSCKFSLSPSAKKRIKSRADHVASHLVKGERREHDTGCEPCTFCGFGNRNCNVVKGKGYVVVCNGGQTPKANSQLNILNKPTKCRLCSSYYYLLNEKAHYMNKHAEAPIPETDLAETIQKLEKVYKTDKDKKTRKRRLKKRSLNTKVKTVNRTVRGKPTAVVTFNTPVPQPLAIMMECD